MNIDIDALNEQIEQTNAIVNQLGEFQNALKAYLSGITAAIQETYDLSELSDNFNSNLDGVISHITEGLTQLSGYLQTKITEFESATQSAGTEIQSASEALASLTLE